MSTEFNQETKIYYIDRLNKLQQEIFDKKEELTDIMLQSYLRERLNLNHEQELEVILSNEDIRTKSINGKEKFLLKDVPMKIKQIVHSKL